MKIKKAGIVGGVGFRCEITGYRGTPNESVKAGTVGIMEPIELSVYGDVVQANFYPDRQPGSVLVTWPIFRSYVEKKSKRS